MDTTTRHAWQRIRERLDSEDALALANAIGHMARSMPDNRAYAVMVTRVDVPRGTFTIHPDGTGPSNGTDLYAIVRDKHLVTVMWRRQAQPVTPEAFRVDVVGKATLR